MVFWQFCFVGVLDRVSPYNAERKTNIVIFNPSILQHVHFAFVLLVIIIILEACSVRSTRVQHRYFQTTLLAFVVLSLFLSLSSSLNLPRRPLRTTFLYSCTIIPQGIKMYNTQYYVYTFAMKVLYKRSLTDYHKLLKISICMYAC